MSDTIARPRMFSGVNYVPIDRSQINRAAREPVEIAAEPEIVPPVPAETRTRRTHSRVVRRKPALPVYSLFSTDGFVAQPRRANIFEQAMEPRSEPSESQKVVDEVTSAKVKIIKQRHTQPEVLNGTTMEEAVAGELVERPRLFRLKFTKSALATGAAVLVFGVGISIFASTLKTNKQVVAQVAQVAQQNDSTSKPAAAGAGVPIEKSVTQSDVNSYRVAANMPRLLRIAKLGVVSRVTQVDQIAATGVLDTPKNIYDTGWYKQSSIPGDAGAALIVGHVHGPIAPGVFYNIKNLVAGDIITVERGDSKALNFKVVKKDQVATDKIDMAAALTPVTAGKPGLNIMTCGGKYNTAKNEYEDRITVYAEQV